MYRRKERTNTYVLLLTILALSFAWTTATSDSGPKPCCWPNKLTGTMAITTPEMHLFTITFYVDFDQGRSIDVSGNDSLIPMEFQYRDYKNNRKFIKLRDGSCKELPMEDLYVQCMPEDARLVNTLKVEQDGRIRNLNSWSYTAPNGGYQGHLVYEDNCHPFIYRLEDPMVGYRFQNLAETIEDYSVFDVDLSGCETIE